LNSSDEYPTVGAIALMGSFCKTFDTVVLPALSKPTTRIDTFLKSKIEQHVS